MEWLVVGVAILTVVAIVVGVVAYGIQHYRKHRSLIGALQASAEKLIADLAKSGQVTKANEAGQLIKRTLEAAGPAVKALNDRHFADTKAKLKAEGLDTRKLIGEALQRIREDG